MQSHLIITGTTLPAMILTAGERLSAVSVEAAGAPIC
jgi:hypothetical protein